MLSLICNRVGRNVAAGMTGGLAYILDEDNSLLSKVCAFLLQWFGGNPTSLKHDKLPFFFSLILLMGQHHLILFACAE